MQEIKVKEKKPRGFNRFIAAAIPPAILLILYLSLSGRKGAMDWINTYIAAPYRSAAAFITSLGPLKNFSVFEVLLTLLILAAIYYIVRAVIAVIKSNNRLKVLWQRLSALILAALYFGALFALLWGAGYHGTDLAEKTGLTSNTVTVEQLKVATRLFAEKANELSFKVKRDSNGHYAESRDNYFGLSKDVYNNIEAQIPALRGTYYPPKPMFYSKIMSATGFTGVYIAFTGETNINVDVPACLTPATIAHEMAHQRGVNFEEEANFAGVAACVTSGIPVYEYSGWLLGLMYLSDALYKADPASCTKITSTLNKNVLTDWNEYSSYWTRYESSVSEAATSAYDGYLKSNGVDSGVLSYGECVRMLALWVDQKNPG